MKASEAIKSKIKLWEGCSYRAYRCPSGVLTIGYGHTGADVKEGDVISVQHASALLDKDIVAFEKGVENLTHGLSQNQNQFDALVSFAFNVGINAFASSTLLKKVRQNPSDPAIRHQFNRWVHGGGKVLPGLVSRRKEEADWYFKK